jgi:two-component system response regulator DctR
MRMTGMSGLSLFNRMLERGQIEAMPVIFLTGHADVPTAVDTVKRGAFDFCEKPFSDNALVDRVEQALALSAEHLEAAGARRGAQPPGRADRSRARRDEAWWSRACRTS